MKKLFTLMLLLAATVSLSAAETIIATLTVSGSATGEWANTLEISGQQLKDAGACEGDIIRLTFTTEDGAQLQLCANSPSWYNLLPSKDVSAADSPYDLTLDATSLANIEADKLYIQGKFITVTKAELVRPTADNETIVATLTPSAIATGEWATTIEVSGAELTQAGAQVGDVVRLSFTTKEGSQLQLCANSPSWYNLLPSKDVTAADSPYDLVLDQQTLTNIEADKLYIQGKRITLTKVELVRTATTGIKAISSTANADEAPVYSLSGIRQSGKLARGIYVKGGKKFIVR